MKTEVLSVHKVWKNKLLFWVKTYKTVLKYVSSEYSDIFRPTIVGSKTGKRYFVKKENVEKFINMFQNNELRK